MKGWKKGANWSFPRGKIDKDEMDFKCAVREVYEETGYDLKEAGLVGEEKDIKYIDVEIRGQDVRLYVFRGVPMDVHFEPRTRKEISKVSWHKLSDLPTVKKRKQQQEGHGEELAVNANKFYMVAPFLGSLKKWISQQRKRDRAMHAKQATAITNTNMSGVESAALEQEALDEQPIDERVEQDHLARLLHTLQQPNQARTSDLSEVSRPVAPQQASEMRDIPRSADLLALLRNGTHPAPEPKPQTPFDQVIEQPPVPRSPPHHPSHRMPHLPPPPSFQLPAAHCQPTSSAQVAFPHSGHNPLPMDAPPPMPEITPIPAPPRPAQLAPRSSGMNAPMAPLNRAPAPYQRTSDQFSQNPHPSLEPQYTAVPPASKLPPPKLTAQASGLLDLFRSGGPSTKTSAADSAIQKPNPPPAVQQEEKNPKTSFQFVPPQVSRSSSTNVPQTSGSPSEHKATLLKLFRTSSVPSTESKGLQPPVTAVELSASPTPGHPRETSRTADASAKAPIPSAGPFCKPATNERHHPSNAPVSATVSGPLNTPQFDMIKSTSRASHGPVQDITTRSGKNSPVRILSRPSSSHGPPVLAPQGDNTHQPASRRKHNPQPAPLVTPSKAVQPPTPDLKAQADPSKPFQPQILRRPGLPQDPGEPSPIQPLPSPQHNVPMAKRLAHSAEQKKSLLSLFTKPPPAISPPSGTAQATEPASLVSPLEKSGTRLPQQGRMDLDDVFGHAPAIPSLRLKSTTHESPLNQVKKFTAPDRMPLASRKDFPTMAVGDDRQSGRSSGKHTPTPTHSSTTTPVQKEFLLGYLADVVKSGR